MSSAVLRVQNPKKRPINGNKPHNNGNIFFRMIIKKSNGASNNLGTTFYNFEDYPEIEVNSQCDNRALNEYMNGKYDQPNEMRLVMKK